MTKFTNNEQRNRTSATNARHIRKSTVTLADRVAYLSKRREQRLLDEKAKGEHQCKK